MNGEQDQGAPGATFGQFGEYPGDVKRKLDQFDARLRRHWGAWRKKARECYDMIDGDQWPQEALDQFDFDNRTAIVANKIAPMLRAISGAEIQNRQEVRFAPREIGDLKGNELWTGAVDWNREEGDFGTEESEAFFDQLACGYGLTETRMDYDDDQEGTVREDVVNPLEVQVDPAARKRNFRDRTFDRRNRPWNLDEAKAEFPELFPEIGSDDDMGEDEFADGGVQSNNEPGDAYDDGDERPEDAEGEGSGVGQGQVLIQHYEWFEKERYYLVIDPMSGQRLEVTRDQWRKLERTGLTNELNSVSLKRKVWWKAFRRGAYIKVERIVDVPRGGSGFSRKYICARLKRKGYPIGLVEPMIDPQRWFNKFLVQLDRIIASNAKGGLLANAGAVDDPEEFEENWTKDNAVHWFQDGYDLDKVARPKPVAQYPAAIDKLLAFSGSVLPDVAGINKETMGQADRDQPIGLEFQRKQAVFGVNADFFDALKAFRQEQGRYHLTLMLKYMSDGRLVRIAGEDGRKFYAQFAAQVRDPDFVRFDVIVDEAPTGPNQRDRVAATLIQLGPTLEKLLKMGLPPDLLVEVLEYLPLPSSMIDKIRTHVQQKAQPDPNAQRQQLMQQTAAQLALEDKRADVEGKRAKAQLTQADAALKGAQAQSAAFDARMKQRIAQLATMGGPANGGGLVAYNQ